MEQINTVCGKNSEFSNVKAGDTYTYGLDLECQNERTIKV
jgi:hypothetical protein